MTVVGFVVLQRDDDGWLVDHMGEPFSHDEAVEVVAGCAATYGGEYVLARVVIEEEA